MKKYLKKKSQLGYHIFLVCLKIFNYFKNISEENISQEFRLKNTDETRNYFLKEIKQNKLMSKKHKKVCTTLNNIKEFLSMAPTITGCIFTLLQFLLLFLSLVSL